MRSLCKKVSDLLKVWDRLAYTAEDTIWTYIQKFEWNTGSKIMICQLQNAKSNFPKFCKVKKNKCDIFTYIFSRNHCFNFSFKSRLQEAFLVKVIYTKKYTT